jgi:hypothetical protein
LSDLEGTGTTITKPRRASVAQIVEMKIFDSSLTQSRGKCLRESRHVRNLRFAIASYEYN